MSDELSVTRGLLQSTLARPRAGAFGGDAYSSIQAKAGALLHSIARNHALVDGNKRLGLDEVEVIAERASTKTTKRRA